MDELRRHRELIESQVNLLHIEANLLHIRQYEGDRLQMLRQLDTLEEAQGKEKYKTVMEWISGAETRLDHDSACQEWNEHPGSGRWILENPELERWKDAEPSMLASSILWLKGIPGAGMWI